MGLFGLFGPSTKAEYDKKIAEKEIECARCEKRAATGIREMDRKSAKQTAQWLKAEIRELKAKRSLCKK